MNKVEYFEFVRDIPYRIPLDAKEVDHCCGGKNKVLHQLFEELRIKVRYRVCDFYWSGLNIPMKILKIPHRDVASHLYLQVYVPKKGKWVNVDATWDKGLSNVFMISTWNGEKDTPLAVKPVRIYLPKNSVCDKNDLKTAINDLNENRKFYKALDNWLEKERGRSLGRAGRRKK